MTYKVFFIILEHGATINVYPIICTGSPIIAPILFTGIWPDRRGGGRAFHSLVYYTTLRDAEVRNIRFRFRLEFRLQLQTPSLSWFPACFSTVFLEGRARRAPAGVLLCARLGVSSHRRARRPRTLRIFAGATRHRGSIRCWRFVSSLLREELLVTDSILAFSRRVRSLGLAGATAYPELKESMLGRGDTEVLFVGVATNTAHVLSSTLRLFCIADRYQASGIRCSIHCSYSRHLGGFSIGTR